jgi:hypothetical protein
MESQDYDLLQKEESEEKQGAEFERAKEFFLDDIEDKLENVCTEIEELLETAANQYPYTEYTDEFRAYIKAQVMEMFPKGIK